MDFLFKGLNDGGSDCPFNAQDIKRCPFLSNINKPTSFAFSTASFPVPVRGAKGPIFEDGPNFDSAFKLFHGKDGVVPLSGKSLFRSDNLETEIAPPKFNPLAAKAATISLSSFGPGGPFSFDSFSKKWDKLKKKSESSKKREPSSQGNSAKHEALGNEWLETGNCPIAKSYRAVSGVLPLVASALQPPPGMKFKCPPAVVAARAALARTALVKSLRPQPLPEKMLVIGVLGMAANVPLGIWREHTRKFSLSWFAAVHAAVPFIAMLRKSVVMPKTAMALTIAASILGQVIGSRAERLRLKVKAEKEAARLVSAGAGASANYDSFILVSAGADASLPGNCGSGGIVWDPLADMASKPASLSAGPGASYSGRVDVIGGGQCGTCEGIVWDPLANKGEKPAPSSANVCF